MKTKIKLLDLTLIGVLYAGGAATPGFAADAYSHSNTDELLEHLRQVSGSAPASSASASARPAPSASTYPRSTSQCTDDTCSSTEDLVEHLRERANPSGIAQVRAPATSASSVSHAPSTHALAKPSSLGKTPGRAALIVSQPVKAAAPRAVAQQAAIARKKSNVVVPRPPVDHTISAISPPVHSSVHKTSAPMAATAAAQVVPTNTPPAPHSPNPVAAVNSGVIVPRKASFRQVSGSSEVTSLKPDSHHPASRGNAPLPTAVAATRPAGPTPAPQAPAGVAVANNSVIVPRKPTSAQAAPSSASVVSPVASPSASAHAAVAHNAAVAAPVAADLHPSSTPAPQPNVPAGSSAAGDLAIVPRKPTTSQATAAVAQTSTSVQQHPVTHDVVATRITPAAIAPIVALPSTPLTPTKQNTQITAATSTVPLATTATTATTAPAAPAAPVPTAPAAAEQAATAPTAPTATAATTPAPAPQAPVTVATDSFIEQRKPAGANSAPNGTSAPASDAVINTPAAGYASTPADMASTGPNDSSPVPLAVAEVGAPKKNAIGLVHTGPGDIPDVIASEHPGNSAGNTNTNTISAKIANANCGDDGCTSPEGMLFQVSTRGEEHPVVPGNSPSELQANRRVDIAVPDSPAIPPQPGIAKINGRFSIDLPDGGVVWATEDPALSQPSLNVQAGSSVPFDNGRILKPVQFQGYTNYASFMRKIEVRIYRGDDDDLVTPLAVIHLPLAGVTKAEWNGTLPPGLNLRAGDTLKYVTRAYAADGNFDETVAQSLQLQTPKDYDRGAQQTRDQAQRALGESLSTDQAQSLKLQSTVFGQNALRVQNIRIYGSRVRIYGRDVPRTYSMKINGQDFPVDQQGKFVAEFLEPIGRHTYTVSVKPPEAPPVEKTLDVNVTGRYSFLVAMADATVSRKGSTDSVSSGVNTENSKDNFVTDGRLAFYSKTKFAGKYLLTAQADTTDRDVHDIFSGFFKADNSPQDVFRNLDPNLYYPTYGDDSTTYRDVDTQGRLYLRLDWDQNEALWGNFSTGFTDTEYAQYNRDLYGAALSWRSHDATVLGDAKTQVKAFGSQAQSVAGHNEFLGTGGSLYYMHQTDILPGSEVVTLEVRDRTTGRVMSSTTMSRGADYQIDNLQGRIILTRPLAQVTRSDITSITRDAPLDGYEQILLVDYEYTPIGLDTNDVTAGLQGKQWFGNHLAVGGTYVNEGRDSGDYTLEGADVTLQQGRGTYLKLEKSHSEAAVAPILYSDNGGFSFLQKNPINGPQSGDAESIEGRANLHELGLTQNDWTLGAWWRNVDSGFSAVSFDTGSQIREYGANFLGYVTKNFSLYGQYSYAENDGEVLKQNQLTAQWRFDEASQIGFELRQLSETNLDGSTANPLLAAVSYDFRYSPSLDLYTIGQYTLSDDHGAYQKNNLVTVGAKYLFANKSSVGAELSDGSRGYGALVNADYQLTTDHDLYSTYRFTTDTTAPDPLFNPDQQAGWTLGQRWRLSNQVNVYNESQFLKDPTENNASGLANTFGMDLYPAVGWKLGFTLQEGKLDATDGEVSRHAYSVSGGRTDERTDWVSKIEYRQDTGAEQRDQWATTNRLLYKINEDWRLAINANYANTTDDIDSTYGARLAEVNAGFAFRPHDSSRWAVFGRYTYLYNLASPGQVSGDAATNIDSQTANYSLDSNTDENYDQRTKVASLEGIYRLDDRWEVAAKAASRWGDYRTGRATGPWLDSRADFLSGQLRYHLIAKWDALVEYRWLGVLDGGDQKGFLAGIDREVGQNFKIGIGYNFSRFSDDLTQVKFDNKGWFLNMTGYY